MNKVTVFRLKDFNVLVIKKTPGDDFFITTNDSIVISTFNLGSVLKFMLFNKVISPKFLQAIVDDYVTSGE